LLVEGIVIGRKRVLARFFFELGAISGAPSFFVIRSMA
jgi:hypothetical protein